MNSKLIRWKSKQNVHFWDIFERHRYISLRADKKWDISSFQHNAFATKKKLMLYLSCIKRFQPKNQAEAISDIWIKTRDIFQYSCFFWVLPTRKHLMQKRQKMKFMLCSVDLKTPFFRNSKGIGLQMIDIWVFETTKYYVMQ